MRLDGITDQGRRPPRRAVFMTGRFIGETQPKVVEISFVFHFHLLQPAFASRSIFFIGNGFVHHHDGRCLISPPFDQVIVEQHFQFMQEQKVRQGAIRPGTLSSTSGLACWVPNTGIAEIDERGHLVVDGRKGGHLHFFYVIEIRNIGVDGIPCLGGVLFNHAGFGDDLTKGSLLPSMMVSRGHSLQSGFIYSHAHECGQYMFYGAYFGSLFGGGTTGGIGHRVAIGLDHGHARHVDPLKLEAKPDWPARSCLH